MSFAPRRSDASVPSAEVHNGLAGVAHKRAVVCLLSCTLLGCITQPDAYEPRVDRLIIAGGSAQLGDPGQTLGVPLRVRARDQRGAPMLGVRVQWAAATGGGSVSPTQSETDANGEAQTIWTLGSVEGEQTVLATAPSIAPTTFRATANLLVARVGISPASVRLPVLDTKQLDGTPFDALDRPLGGRTLTWTSSDANIAAVNATSGLITAGSALGVAVISARSANGKVGTSTVIVQRAFTAVSAGSNYGCGLVGNEGYCWGFNSSGQRGDGTKANAVVPTPVSGGLRFDAIAASQHTCAKTLANAIYCWGNNNFGEIGNGTLGLSVVPVLAAGPPFLTIAVGPNHTCGLEVNGTTYCWGFNDRGQLGDGTRTNRTVPTAVSGSENFFFSNINGAVNLALGTQHTCSRQQSGPIYCWGDNGSGQLGDGSTTERTSPVLVKGGPFSWVTAGTSHSCGIGAGNAAQCWGGGGMLGDGTTTIRSGAGPVSGGFSFTQISTYSNFTCALSALGAAYCWGTNTYGQVGDGSTDNRTTPVAVAGGIKFDRISAGDNHACGMTQRGAVYCWGFNAFGQLGDGTTKSSATPVLVIVP